MGREKWKTEAITLLRKYGIACAKDAQACQGRITNSGPLPVHWRKEITKHFDAIPLVLPAEIETLHAELRGIAADVFGDKVGKLVIDKQSACRWLEALSKMEQSE